MHSSIAKQASPCIVYRTWGFKGVFTEDFLRSIRLDIKLSKISCQVEDNSNYSLKITFNRSLCNINLSIFRFFSVAFLYIIGGIVLQKGVRGANGKEVIPNSNFWLALPGLIKVINNIYKQMIQPDGLLTFNTWRGGFMVDRGSYSAIWSLPLTNV